MRHDSDAQADTRALGPVPALTSTDPRIGQVVADRYKVLGKIGRGGMGSIYEAEHTLTGKRFAIKTLLPGLDRVDEIARRFEREARASSVLNHPNVIAVMDFGRLDDGGLYLAMEYVRGRPLGDLIEEGGVSQPRAFAIARQVVEALAHAHAHGVIHRDLKPDNVMVVEDDDEGDRVKLLDFGIAKVVGDAAEQVGGDKLTVAGIAFGTPDYMAPEQALGETVDARADLYAMGVILFELLTGRKPFVNADKMAVLRMQVAVPPPPLSIAAPGRRFTPETEALVARALEKRRADRFASAEEMLAALEVAIPGQLELGMQSSAPPRPPTPPPVPLPPPQAPPPAPLAAPSTIDPDAPAGLAALPVTVQPPFGLPAWVTRRNVLIAGGALFLVVLLVVIAVAASGGDRAPRTPMPSIGPALAKTERAIRGEKLLAEGGAERAIALLEAETTGGSGATDPFAYLILGHARAAAGRELEALVAYERALSIERRLADDPTLRAHAEEYLGRKDRTISMAALDLLGRLGEHGHAALVEQASRGKVKELRRRARDLAEREGITKQVDLVSSYSLDLQQGKTCAERREAVPRLRALRDKRAIPALKKARGRSGGFLGLEDINTCLEKDAKEATEFLEAL
jgi:serine/threonine-protein kinase